LASLSDTIFLDKSLAHSLDGALIRPLRASTASFT